MPMAGLDSFPTCWREAFCCRGMLSGDDIEVIPAESVRKNRRTRGQLRKPKILKRKSGSKRKAKLRNDIIMRKESSFLPHDPEDHYGSDDVYRDDSADGDELSVLSIEDRVENSSEAPRGFIQKIDGPVTV